MQLKYNSSDVKHLIIHRYYFSINFIKLYQIIYTVLGSQQVTIVYGCCYALCSVLEGISFVTFDKFCIRPYMFFICHRSKNRSLVVFKVYLCKSVQNGYQFKLLKASTVTLLSDFSHAIKENKHLKDFMCLHTKYSLNYTYALQYLKKFKCIKLKVNEK